MLLVSYSRLFCTWEFLTAVLYGRSHFFTRLGGGRRSGPLAIGFLTALHQRLVLKKGPLCTMPAQSAWRGLRPGSFVAAGAAEVLGLHAGAG